VSDAAHILESAAGLAALPLDDPERANAYAHARECAQCARALHQAERLLAMLDAVPQAPAPPPPTLRSIAGPILVRLSALVVPARLLSAVLVATWLALVFMAKRRAGGGLAWVESAALVGVALACLASLRRIGSLAAWLAFGASALLAALAWGDGPLAPRMGVACLLTELGAAAIPIAIVVRAFIRRRSTRPTLGLVVVAAAGALVGQAALHLTCPDRNAGLHVLAFHLGGVALAAAAAFLIGGLLARRAPTEL